MLVPGIWPHFVGPFLTKNEVIGSKKTRTKHHNRPPNSTIVSSGECRNEVGVEGIIS